MTDLNNKEINKNLAISCFLAGFVLAPFGIAIYFMSFQIFLAACVWVLFWLLVSAFVNG